MPRPFLTARWANLAIVSYAVPPAVLAPYMPVGPEGDRLELDTRDDLTPGGVRGPSAFVSLVAFEFQRCRVWGVSWPGHTDFAEVNLRFYVRTAGSRQRGVVFIREFVPQRLTAWAARKFYNEPYLAAPVWARVNQDASRVRAEYGLEWPPGQTQRLAVSARKPLVRPGQGTVEHWFKEHSLGFGMLPARGKRPARGLAYEVIHPTWGVYPVQECEVMVDFAAVYGPDWGFLSAVRPVSVVLAAGSEVSVFPGRSSVGIRWGIKRE